MEGKLFTAVLICVVAAATAHNKHHQNANANRYGYYSASNSRDGGKVNNNNVTDQFIQQKITTFLNQKNNTADLIQFLTALNTTEGQDAVKQLGVKPGTVQKLLTQLRGPAQNVTAAKAEIQTIVQSFSNVKQRKFSSKVRRLFQIYQIYLIRQEAQRQVQQASVEDLKKVFAALVIDENRLGFRGINFDDLLQILNAKGQQGRQEVVDKLVKWVGHATIDDLQRASKVVYMKVITKPMDVTTIRPAGNLTTTVTMAPTNFTTTRPAGNTTQPIGNLTTTVAPNNATAPARAEPLRKKLKP